MKDRYSELNKHYWFLNPKKKIQNKKSLVKKDRDLELQILRHGALVTCCSHFSSADIIYVEFKLQHQLVDRHGTHIQEGKELRRLRNALE